MAAAVSQSPGPAGLPGGPTGLQSRSQWHWLHVFLILSENLHQPRPKKHWDINNRAVQFCYEIFHLLPHRNPAVLWFKNSRELETKPFTKSRANQRFSAQKHGWSEEPPAWKAAASNTIRKTQEKGLRKSSSSFFLGCVATGASSKFLREHSNMLCRWNGYRKYWLWKEKIPAR